MVPSRTNLVVAIPLTLGILQLVLVFVGMSQAGYHVSGSPAWRYVFVALIVIGVVGGEYILALRFMPIMTTVVLPGLLVGFIAAMGAVEGMATAIFVAPLAAERTMLRQQRRDFGTHWYRATHRREASQGDEAARTAAWAARVAARPRSARTALFRPDPDSSGNSSTHEEPSELQPP